MGPASVNSVPTRPRFAWDAKSPPWTDGVGNQERYKKAVLDWKEYHDSLAENNPNKVSPNIQGIILKSQLFGQAEDLCSELTNEQLKEADGVNLIINKVYERDALSVVSETYDYFNSLWSTRRKPNESFKTFEKRFTAALSKFNSIANATKLPPCITALMLLSNSSVDHNQRVSILAAIAPNNDQFSEDSSNDDYLSVVTYNSVASVVKQCDRSEPQQSNLSLNASSGLFNKGASSNASRSPHRSRRPPVSMLLKYPCDLCRQYGHWKPSHRTDNSLRHPCIPSFKTSEEFAAHLNKNNPAHRKSQPRSDSKRNTVSFNMAVLSGSSTSVSQNDENIYIYGNHQANNLGPLLDDGAPYSAIGFVELQLLRQHIGLTTEPNINPIPSSLQGHTHWQYGTGRHSSAARRILGSIVLNALTDTGTTVNIRHLVLDGSSQWVIGRNVTSKANIRHLQNDAIQFPVGDSMDEISLIKVGFLCHMPLSTFASASQDDSILSCLNGNVLSKKSWPEIKKIIEKVHKHICGHANLTDIRLLLQRNDIWNDHIEDYVHRLIEGCHKCQSTAPPQPPRKVSISSLSKGLNNLVCVDHFFLNGITIFHAMDTVTRFSAAQVVSSTSLEEAVLAFETCWVAQFGYPDAIQGDDAFMKGAFMDFMNAFDITARPVPPGRHHKNPIESKHKVIRSIFLRLNESSDSGENSMNHVDRLEAIRAVHISNDLYGNDIMSAFELSHGYTNRIDSGHARNISPDIMDAHEKLQAKRKLSLILRSRAPTEVPISVGDMVDVFLRTGMSKQGKWSTPKIVLQVDHAARSVVVPSKFGRRSTVAFEDIRLSLAEESLANDVQHAIDDLEKSIEEAVDENFSLTDDANLDTSGNGDSSCSESSPSQSSTISPIDNAPDANFCDSNASIIVQEPLEVRKGDHISVYWSDDDQFYPGTIQTCHRNGEFTVLYDDGDRERLNLSEEQWKFTSTADASTACVSSHAMSANDIGQEELLRMKKYFGNKPFLKHQAQGFEQFSLVNSYRDEEATFLKTVSVVPRSEVPSDANVINSHVLYKLKDNDDGSLKLKARIAPHGNEDNLKDILASDCSTCPPSGLRILQSVATIKKWTIYKADAIAAFLQTGKAQRQVYVKPPNESSMRRSHLWLLDTAAYGLVNSNAKWQLQSDELMFNLGLTQSKNIPQLFYKTENYELILIVAKVVDDLMITGKPDARTAFINNFDKKFKLGTVNQGPGSLRFFGINTIQNEDFYISTNADDKLESIQTSFISRLRRKEYSDDINEIEKKSFASVNSSIGWIGSAASPLCSFHASHLQQMTPDTKVSHLIDQVNILKKLKRLGTSISYIRPDVKGEVPVSVLCFSDASKREAHGQVGCISGLLIGDFTKDAVFHPISWISHKSKRPVKSVPAAEVIAAAEAIDDAKTVAATYSEVLSMDVRVKLCVDSKDLFTSLSTQRNSVDRSIRGDVASIRFEYQVGNVSDIIWIPGKTNLADALTKTDSPLTSALILTLFSGKLSIDYSESESKSSINRNYG